MISPDNLFTLGSAVGLGLMVLAVHVWRERSEPADQNTFTRLPAE